jgi:hypothetical protein
MSSGRNVRPRRTLIAVNLKVAVMNKELFSIANFGYFMQTLMTPGKKKS